MKAINDEYAILKIVHSKVLKKDHEWE